MSLSNFQSVIRADMLTEMDGREYVIFHLSTIILQCFDFPPGQVQVQVYLGNGQDDRRRTEEGHRKGKIN
jgi:hypothetical protein